MRPSGREILHGLEARLRAASLVVDVSLEVMGPPSAAALAAAEEHLGVALRDTWYAELDGLTLSWRSAPTHDFNLAGRCGILPLQEVCGAWRDILYFEDDSPLVRFHPIDMFVDEALVGIYRGSRQLFFYDLHDEPSPLEVDLADYLVLIAETSGFLYWQRNLLAVRSADESTESRRYRDNMPTLFPDRSRSTLDELYREIVTRPPKKRRR